MTPRASSAALSATAAPVVAPKWFAPKSTEVLAAIVDKTIVTSSSKARVLAVSRIFSSKSFGYFSTSALRTFCLKPLTVLAETSIAVKVEVAGVISDETCSVIVPNAGMSRV